MAKVLIETNGAKLISDEGVEVELRIGYDSAETSGQNLLLIHTYSNGALVGTPIRFKLGGNRLAADFPGGLNGNFFITDSEGRITNG